MSIREREGEGTDEMAEKGDVSRFSLETGKSCARLTGLLQVLVVLKLRQVELFTVTANIGYKQRCLLQCKY